MVGACDQNPTRRLVDPSWSHMPLANCSVAGFSCLQMATLHATIEWLLTVMGESSNFVLKRIGTYDLTGSKLGKGNFAYVELATNRITKSKVCSMSLPYDDNAIYKGLFVGLITPIVGHCHELWVCRMGIIHRFNYARWPVLLLITVSFAAA